MTDYVVYEVSTIGLHPDPQIRCRLCGKRPWIVQVIDSSGTGQRLLCECDDSD
jgi:hypothetical protein